MLTPARASESQPIGEENLTKPDIAQVISGAMMERSKRTEVTQDQVIEELRKKGAAVGKCWYRARRPRILSSASAADPEEGISIRYNRYNPMFMRVSE